MPRPPLVTFAIATHNRGPVVADCLRHTLANGLPDSQFEIILIDNASTDGTPELLQQQFAGDRRFHLVRLNSNCGPVAKNIALRKAQGEFIVLLDDDAFPHPGAVPQMLRHFRDNPNLAAAVFDVTLPDGSKDAAAYPDIFIGAGTGLRRSMLQKLPGGGFLPAHFFMQAEEYDLSFRLLEAGFSIERFWDLPLTHLKAPHARIGQRTTCLDVRNNLFLLARYLPDQLSKQLAADWMSRYWFMAEARDRAANHVPHPTFGTHKKAFMHGAAEGLHKWSAQRAGGRRILSPPTLERIFKFQKIRDRLAHAQKRTGARRIVFADFGKNMLAYWMAARDLGLQVRGIIDERLASGEPESIPGRDREEGGGQRVGEGGQSAGKPREYRGVPLWNIPQEPADLVVVSNMSPVQAPRRAAALRRTLRTPVVDLFSRQDVIMHRAAVVA